MEKEITKLYQSGLSSLKIAQIFNCSKHRVLDILHRTNTIIRPPQVANRRFFFDTRYFASIDTEEKAYWLGFLMADGCVHQTKQKKRSSLIVVLQARDIEHLKKLSKAMGNKTPLKIRRDKSVGLSLYSQILVADLIKLGCVINKSLILKPPNIKLTENNIRHFIRGYFDGDGCAYLSHNKYKNSTYLALAIEIFGTMEFLQWVKSKLPLSLKEKCQIRSCRKNTTVQRIRLHLSRVNLMNEWKKFLYNKSSVYLERKKDKIEKIIQLKLHQV